jgi:hypothetical protein
MNRSAKHAIRVRRTQPAALRTPSQIVRPTSPEPFVGKIVAAEFSGFSPRKLLCLARQRLIRGYPDGKIRNTWRFRLSELAEDIVALGNRSQYTLEPAAPVSRRKKSNG